MKKSIILGICCMSLFLAANAQQPTNRATSTSNATAQDYEQMLESAHNVGFRSYVIKSLGLTEQQIKSFDPMYRDYMNKKNELTQKKMKLYNEYLEEIAENDSPRNEENDKEEFIEDYLEVETAESKLRKETFDRMEDVITADNALGFLLLEDMAASHLYDQMLYRHFTPYVVIMEGSTSNQTSGNTNGNAQSDKYSSNSNNNSTNNGSANYNSNSNTNSTTNRDATGNSNSTTNRSVTGSNNGNTIPPNNQSTNSPAYNSANNNTPPNYSYQDNSIKTDNTGVNRNDNEMLPRTNTNSTNPPNSTNSMNSTNSTNSTSSTTPSSTTTPKGVTTRSTSASSRYRTDIATYSSWAKSTKANVDSSHEYSRDGLKNAVTAIGSLRMACNGTADNNFETKKNKITANSNELTKDPHSMTHPRLMRESFILVADMLKDVQRQCGHTSSTNAVNQVAEAARKLDVNKTTYSQAALIQDFFQKTQAAIDDMADDISWSNN